MSRSHPTLFDVPKDSPSREQRLAEFKREHGVWTYHSKHMSREDECWSALLLLPGETEKAMWERIGSRCSALEDEGSLVTGRTEREAIERLCENCGLPKPTL
jgi:hypothetical protein